MIWYGSSNYEIFIIITTSIFYNYEQLYIFYNIIIWCTELICRIYIIIMRFIFRSWSPDEKSKVSQLYDWYVVSRLVILCFWTDVRRIHQRKEITFTLWLISCFLITVILLSCNYENVLKNAASFEWSGMRHNLKCARR